MIIDALGKACPIPVLLAKKQLESGDHNFEILVDNEIAVSNLKRFAENKGFQVQVENSEGEHKIRIFGQSLHLDIQPEKSQEITVSNTAYYIGKDVLGDGERELGYNLLKMALYTLSEADMTPESILFMNAGVKMATSDDAQVFDSIEALIKNGCNILVCGTCLDYYGLKDELKHGTISNMYDILTAMESAQKVISL